MSPHEQWREEEVFHAALEISGVAERQAYLDGACGGDHELRRSVEELLQAHECAREVSETESDESFPLSEERSVWRNQAIESVRASPKCSMAALLPPVVLSLSWSWCEGCPSLITATNTD